MEISATATQITVTAGGSETVTRKTFYGSMSLFTPGTFVSASPGSGGTAKVEVTASPAAEIGGGTAVWHTWAKGEVSSPGADTLQAYATGLRLSAASADAVFDIAGA